MRRIFSFLIAFAGFAFISGLIIYGAYSSGFCVWLFNRYEQPAVITQSGSAEWVIEMDIGIWRMHCLVLGANATDLASEVERAKAFINSYLVSKDFLSEEILIQETNGTASDRDSFTTPGGVNVKPSDSYRMLEICVKTRNFGKIQFIESTCAKFSAMARESRILLNLEAPRYEYSRLDELKKALRQEAIRDAEKKVVAAVRKGSESVTEETFSWLGATNDTSLGGRSGQRVRATVNVQFTLE